MKCKESAKSRVLDLLAGGKCPQAVCDSLGIDQSTLWRWRQADRRFAEAVADAIFRRRHGKELARLEAQVTALEAQFGDALPCR